MGVAVVTGGASGIGLALATALGERGATLVLADIDAAALQTARTSLAERGMDAHDVVVDIRDPAALERLAETATTLGPIDVVCCNAGVAAHGASVWDTEERVFDLAFAVNLGGLLHSLRAFVPRLIAAQRPASIVITASMAGLVAGPTSGAYAASKAAAIAIAKALRGELAVAAPEVHVVVLAPGMVQTNLSRTSAAQQAAGDVPAAMVEAVHAALNEQGVEATEAAGWVLDALDSERFWALPPADDSFMKVLATEIAELNAATR